MISSEVKLVAIGLLATGRWSRRDVASIVGISRGAVSALMATNPWDILGQYHKGSLIHPTGKYVRCSCCGGMVQMPCHLCYVANGGVYPESVLEQYRNPTCLDKVRKCQKCGQDFGNHDSEGSDYLVHRFCRACRSESVRLWPVPGPRKLRMGDILDIRKVPGSYNRKWSYPEDNAK